MTIFLLQYHYRYWRLIVCDRSDRRTGNRNGRRRYCTPVTRSAGGYRPLYCVAVCVRYSYAMFLPRRCLTVRRRGTSISLRTRDENLSARNHGRQKRDDDRGQMTYASRVHVRVQVGGMEQCDVVVCEKIEFLERLTMRWGGYTRGTITWCGLNFVFKTAVVALEGKNRTNALHKRTSRGDERLCTLESDNLDVWKTVGVIFEIFHTGELLE